MATAYAAMISLMNTLIRFQLPSCPVSFEQSQLSSLFDKVSSLVDLLEAHSHKMSKDLLTTMADAAFKAEDTIESYYVYKVIEKHEGGLEKHEGGTGKNTIFESWMGRIAKKVFKRSMKNLKIQVRRRVPPATPSHCPSIFCQDMEEAICRMDVILQKSMEVAEQNHEKVHVQPERSVSVRGGSVLAPDEKVNMVGLDQEMLGLILEQLMSDKSSRQIIPVVGMGGIGKTTLARNVYDHAYVKYHFHIQKWVTISQGYNVGNILASLLEATHDESKSTESLGELLHKSLSGRKYLVILDDIWDDLAWDEIRRFFPDNNNGSRILLTTRNLDVALSVGSREPHKVKLLGDDESWELLSQTIFRQEICPPELVECGKKIAKGCRGLPLAIATVGGLLKTSNGTLEFWKNVAENVSSFISVQNESHCLEILSLSYNHLPIYLKPCFLYLATFKEDEDVLTFKLIKLWVANGFLKPSKDKTLEEVGIEYLNHLVDRNLIMVTDRFRTGEIDSVSFHDLLREFCLREAADTRFLYQVKKDLLHVPEVLDSVRHLVCHFLSSEIIPFPLVPFVRSSTYSAIGDESIDLTSYKLLRVLRSNSSTSLKSQTHLVNFRYLSYNFKKNSVPGFFVAPFLVWNLETLECLGRYDEFITLPSVLWELPNLRHLFSLSASATILLPDPTNAQAKCVLNNLQSLINILNFNLTNEVLEKIPEVRRLEITYNGDFCSENSEKLASYITNLARLRNLETLICTFWVGCLEDLCVFKEKDTLSFSPNLRELRLGGCYIPWENMTVIGSLPNLQVLFLWPNAFCGGEWNSTEGEFMCLKYLEIEECDLRIWRAESSHFPRLEELNIFDCKELEIPLGIADIASLEKIELWTTKMSAVISAKEILDERENQGNDGLSILVVYYGKPDEEEEVLNLASDNFQVIFRWNRRQSRHI